MLYEKNQQKKEKHRKMYGIMIFSEIDFVAIQGGIIVNT